MMYADPRGSFAISTLLLTSPVESLVSWGLSEIFGDQIAGGISSIVGGGTVISTGISLCAYILWQAVQSFGKQLCSNFLSCYAKGLFSFIISKVAVIGKSWFFSCEVRSEKVTSRSCCHFVCLCALIASFFNASLQKPLKAQRICHWVRVGSFLVSPPFATAKNGWFPFHKLSTKRI